MYSKHKMKLNLLFILLYLFIIKILNLGFRTQKETKRDPNIKAVCTCSVFFNSKHL